MTKPPAALACPHCGQALGSITDAVVGCAAGHRFDMARQGYVALLGARSRTDTGDSSDMVAAREEFLGRGHFEPIADAVALACAGDAGLSASGHRDATGTVLELGAGTGYYLRAALEALPGWQGIAVDASRFAARRSATDRRLFSVLADAWSVLPVSTGSVRTLLSIFAPRDPGELTRVLEPGGHLVAVVPEPDHLRQVREPLGLLAVDGGKADRLAAILTGLAPVSRRTVSYPMALTQSDAAALVRMGPSARHLDPETIAGRVAVLDELTEVTASVTVSVLRRPRTDVPA